MTQLRPVSNRQKVRELEDLIDLAVNVSSKIDQLSRQVSNNAIGIFLTLVLVMAALYVALLTDVFYEENKLYFAVGVVLIIVFSILNFMRSYFIIEKTYTQMNNERKILDNLLDLIHPFKETMMDELSIVKKATLEMKLNRIKKHLRSYHK